MTESTPDMHPMSDLSALEVRTPEELERLRLEEQVRNANVLGGVSFTTVQEKGNQ